MERLDGLAVLESLGAGMRMRISVVLMNKLLPCICSREFPRKPPVPCLEELYLLNFCGECVHMCLHMRMCIHVWKNSICCTFVVNVYTCVYTCACAVRGDVPISVVGLLEGACKAISCRMVLHTFITY